jgi:hypothetical protein
LLYRLAAYMIPNIVHGGYCLFLLLLATFYYCTGMYSLHLGLINTMPKKTISIKKAEVFPLLFYFYINRINSHQLLRRGF